MKSFKNFYITGHTFDPASLIATFSYSFDHEVNFTETINFSCTGFSPSLEERDLGWGLFHLSIALAISYFKLSPTANLVIENGYLDIGQIKFWQTFYLNGLGEFFYQNKLKPIIPNFLSDYPPWQGRGTAGQPGVVGLSTSDKALIPIGGGKDSLVALELIKKTWLSLALTTFGKEHEVHQSVTQSIGLPRLLIQRKLDPLLFQMNTQWYYNGHVPISGITAFVLLVTAYLYDYRYIVMANEKSANEGNTELDGMTINHQRSKSLEFEQAFSDYISKYISTDIKYFSILRGMYEIKIVQEFCKHPQYFHIFSSCNRNFHIEKSPLTKGGGGDLKRRCWSCPKCAFVYTLMSAFLPQEKVIQIFGKDMFADESLIPLFQQLLGISGIKPFECVGTNEEMILALYMAHRRDSSSVPKLFLTHILPHMTEADFFALENKLMKIYNDDLIPPEIKEKIGIF